MSAPKKDEYPTKLHAGIFFWSGVYEALSPIMTAHLDLALAYAPDMLKRGNVNPIEFFSAILLELHQLGVERSEPIFHQKRDELRDKLCKAVHRLARTHAAHLADKLDPSISKSYDEKTIDEWATVHLVADLLST